VTIRRIREARGIPQVVLGAEIGLDSAGICRLENGQRAITLWEAVAIADLLGVSDVREFVSACPICRGVPPSGFSCNDCGRSA
jgi:ribosome-binding protein aMBF1 (putative translation factor)